MSNGDKLTPKQERFCLLYIELSNAAEAYRRAYACANMSAATIQREATRLLANPTITTRLTQLRAAAAEKAVVDQAWVLERLKQNVEVSLGEKSIRLKVQHRDKESGAVTVSEVEISAHDAGAANKGLEILARHLNMFEGDRSAAGTAMGEALGKELSDLEFARWLAFKLANGAKQAESETGGGDVIH